MTCCARQDPARSRHRHRRRSSHERQRRSHRGRDHRARGRQARTSTTARSRRCSDISLTHPAEEGHRLHRPVRLRQVDAAALLQPHERPDRRLPHRRARSASTARTSTTSDVDVAQLRRRVGMVFQKSNPFPKTIYENVAYGLRLAGINKQARARRDRRVGLQGGGAVGRGQGPPGGYRARPVGRPAAAPGASRAPSPSSRR